VADKEVQLTAACDVLAQHSAATPINSEVKQFLNTCLVAVFIA
jgi:hypothetical protein